MTFNFFTNSNKQNTTQSYKAGSSNTENQILLVEKLLSKNQIAYDKKELTFQIKSHPSYPSLHAITGVLDHFNIENVAAKVPVDIDTLAQLPNIFIAQIHTDRGNDLVTISKSKNEYKIFSGIKKEETISIEEFLLKFTGIIVAVEKDENEKYSPRKSILKRILLFSILIFAIGFLFIDKNIQLSGFPFILFTVLGIITSYSILKQEFGENSFIGNAFCSGQSEKKDCNAVLTSKGAEIIKNHKLSDISIIYFSSLLLASLLSNELTLIYTISFLALPITLYSIYYQYKTVKSWCSLCLTIVGILWIQALISYFHFDNHPFLLNRNDILITIISFVTIYLAWSFMKPLAENVLNLQKEKIEFVKFKRNFNLFHSLLSKSPKIDTRIKATKEISFGCQNTTLELIMITNPFCGHCKPVHHLMNRILEKHGNSIKIIPRFNVDTNNPETNGAIVATRLLAIFNKKGEQVCKKAMDEIYSGMSYEKWISKWGKSLDQSYLETIQIEKDWCTANAINFTPEILINGQSFPKEYKREDLLFFIEDLEESYQALELQEVQA
ncbi:hypothetical protein GCM10022393_08410 [Aquimarina addita]|uniref:Vitamin K epoxide reductase domain-containing protein n=1 Tax=Aquimarina addita TaxID=870485 RepID=A0ABP7XDB7_9FLAO